MCKLPVPTRDADALLHSLPSTSPSTYSMFWCGPLGTSSPHERDRPINPHTKLITIQGVIYHLEIASAGAESGYIAQCSELPGALAQGRSLCQAVENGRHAIESVLSFRQLSKTTP